MRNRLIPRTLRARLVAAAAGSLIVAIALFAGATISLVGDSLRGSLDDALRTRAEEVAQLAISAPAVLTAPGALESPVSERQLSVEVLDARGRIIARSLTLGSRLLPLDAVTRRALGSGATGFEPIHLAGRSFRMFAAPIAEAGGPAAGGAVLVAAETGDIEHTTHHLAVVLALLGAGIAVLAAAAAAALTRRAMRPLPAVVAAAEEIERTGDPARRIPEPPEDGVPPAREIAGLTGVLNRMLGSLERSRDAERRFLADASHELRTPVTTLLGNVQYLARHGIDEEVLDELGRDAERLARLVDDLLTLERAGAAPDGRPATAVPLAEVVREVAGELDRGEGRVQAAPIEAASVAGDPESLRRVVRNLIENGLVHGPDGGRVTVSLRVAGPDAVLAVGDEGPGPRPEDRGHLFERFWRGAEAAERPGSGLGLSIVGALVRTAGGSIDVAGPVFTVRLPVVTP